jgi:hypothetical protein
VEKIVEKIVADVSQVVLAGCCASLGDIATGRIFRYNQAMSVRLVNIDRDTPLLFPEDLREWLPENHLVHFMGTSGNSIQKYKSMIKYFL